MIEQIANLPDNVVGFLAKDEVTSDDYQQRLVPAIERALAAHDKIRLLYVFGGDFTGYPDGSCGKTERSALNTSLDGSESPSYRTSHGSDTP